MVGYIPSKHSSGISCTNYEELLRFFSDFSFVFGFSEIRSKGASSGHTYEGESPRGDYRATRIGIERVKEECKGGEGDFLETNEGTERKQILKRSGAPEVSICGENEFPSDKEQDFQRSVKGEVYEEAFRDFPLKAEEEGDNDRENEDGAINQ